MFNREEFVFLQSFQERPPLTGKFEQAFGEPRGGSRASQQHAGRYSQDVHPIHVRFAHSRSELSRKFSSAAASFRFKRSNPISCSSWLMAATRERRADSSPSRRRFWAKSRVACSSSEKSFKRMPLAMPVSIAACSSSSMSSG